MYEFLKKVTDSKKYEIITPYFKYEEENKLYPDRAILKIENSDENEKIVNEIEEFKDAAFNKFLERIKNSESKNDVLEDLEKINEIVKKNENKDYKYNREKQIDLLKEYINFNTVLMNIEKSEEIKDIFSKLDGIELIKNFPIQYNEKEINGIIADSLSEKIKLNENSFSVNENKYRAIISLDLDNMGKFSQKEIKKIKKVSEGIYKYISKLRNFIKSKEINGKSEGLVLYAAGDDILAILNPKYIFEFIKEACNSLKESFKEVIEDNKELSVSFGIFICYEKNPIKESIEKAHDLLFYNAKKLNKKNSAVILVQKHSGYSFEFVINDLVKEIEFNKDNIFFDKVNNYLKDYMESKKVDKKELLNTIIQKVYMNNFVFKEIIQDSRQIGYFLDNLFDSNAKENPLIRDLEELLIHVGKENPEGKKEEFEIKLEKVISYFKLIKFYEDRGGK